MSNYNPAEQIQDLQYFGEFGGVNPSITDSSTFTFLQAGKMEELFEKEIEGCYLYSRHWNPMNKYLSNALAKMEGTESASVTGSGMAAITNVILQICSSGDEIVSSRTIYGGTYAFFKNFLPKFGIKVTFVDSTDMSKVRAAITSKTKIIYCESISNPMLEIADLPALSKIAKEFGCKLVVDNTFSPLMISPALHGADVVAHSMTKFINGMSDCVAGAICGTKEFIDSLSDVNSGASMLLGPVLDSFRSASILKNMRTLHVRMKQHSANALYITTKLSADGNKIIYPGLPNHPQHQLMQTIWNSEFGFGGLFVIDMQTKEKANKLMELMQNNNVGYLAVSLGNYKTLFSAPGGSTSSEIPEEERIAIGLTDGLVRVSIGLDNNPERTYQLIKKCIEQV
ncbi:MAG: aminotransferase class I/II-fold pyridoxal phosphate-dependent enzyme [Flavobacteriales bacterium]|nr:L-methionine gamma-lyase [Flavobacteriales bacterium]MBX2959423.1 aminotransferase class I/II-fold pyridoxal phosphate-dependent enzyme [Flavobacteriales bacterium]